MHTNLAVRGAGNDHFLLWRIELPDERGKPSPRVHDTRLHWTHYDGHRVWIPQVEGQLLANSGETV